MEKKKIEVEVDFIIGDEAWLRVSPHFREKNEKCHACKGVGKIIALDNKPYKCPCCSGNGKLFKGTQDGYIAAYGKVVGVYFQNLQIGENTSTAPLKPPSIVYDVEYQPNGIIKHKPVSVLFHSREEAEDR